MGGRTLKVVKHLLNHICHETRLELVTELKAWKGKQFEKMFQNSNTFSQVWESESQQFI